ncbi:hypothetical protein CLOSCI_02915 [[Clostridium] scindens ATCC 35704]|nr:hypothetical protein CLOSCI_02915 [[Clostridium] scindens ATCC 35704]
MKGRGEPDMAADRVEKLFKKQLTACRGWMPSAWQGCKDL